MNIYKFIAIVVVGFLYLLIISFSRYILKIHWADKIQTENVNVGIRFFIWLVVSFFRAREHGKVRRWHFSHYYYSIANGIDLNITFVAVRFFLLSSTFFIRWFHWTQFLLLAIASRELFSIWERMPVLRIQSLLLMNHQMIALLLKSLFFSLRF